MCSVARWYDLDGEIRSFEPPYDPPPEPLIEWEIYDLYGIIQK